MSDQQYCVLIVDDERLIAETMSYVVEDMGLPVCGIAATADQAVALAMVHRPMVVLMDAGLKGEKDGVDAARAIHAAMDARIIFLTGSRDATTLNRIQLGKPFAVLTKPASADRIGRAISDAMRG